MSPSSPRCDPRWRLSAAGLTRPPTRCCVAGPSAAPAAACEPRSGTHWHSRRGGRSSVIKGCLDPRPSSGCKHSPPPRGETEAHRPGSPDVLLAPSLRRDPSRERPFPVARETLSGKPRQLRPIQRTRRRSPKPPQATDLRAGRRRLTMPHPERQAYRKERSRSRKGRGLAVPSARPPAPASPRGSERAGCTGQHARGSSTPGVSNRSPETLALRLVGGAVDAGRSGTRPSRRSLVLDWGSRGWPRSRRMSPESELS
jgi:hypothetical protein